MNKYTLRINKENDYSLLFYDDTFMYSTFNMIIEGESSDKFFTEMSKITDLQIFNEDGVIIKSTNKYSTIQGTQIIPTGTYLTEEGVNIPCIKVTLKEAEVVARLEKVEETLYTTIDVDAMSLEDYKEYKKSIVSEACEESIHAGIDFETSPGVVEHFTYYNEDQINFADMNQQVEAGFEIIPYHSSREDSLITSPCKMYPAKVIRGIYVAQLSNKLIQTTKCNHIYQWIDGLDNKEAIQGITFEGELPEPYLTSFNAIVNEAVETMSAKDMSKTITEGISEEVASMFESFKEVLNKQLVVVKEEVKTAVLAEVAETVKAKAEEQVGLYITAEKETVVADVTNGVLANIDATVSGKVDILFAEKEEYLISRIRDGFEAEVGIKINEMNDSIETSKAINEEIESTREEISGKVEEANSLVAELNTIKNTTEESVNAKIEEVDLKLAEVEEALNAIKESESNMEEIPSEEETPVEEETTEPEVPVEEPTE